MPARFPRASSSHLSAAELSLTPPDCLHVDRAPVSQQSACLISLLQVMQPVISTFLCSFLFSAIHKAMLPAVWHLCPPAMLIRQRCGGAGAPDGSLQD